MVQKKRSKERFFFMKNFNLFQQYLFKDIVLFTRICSFKKLLFSNQMDLPIYRTVNLVMQFLVYLRNYHQN